MLKVMDPNVHQMQIGRRDPSRFKDGGSDDDDGDEAFTHKSDATGNRTVIIQGGIEPKLQMKKKIARQSDLIHSLEKSEVRKSTELLQLKKHIRKQEEMIKSL